MRRGIATGIIAGIVTTVLIAVVGCGGPAPAARPGLAGDWHGTIDAAGGARLAFGAHLSDDGTGTVDIPQQNAQGLRVSGVRLTGDAVTFALPDVPPGGGTFTGTLAADGNSVAGTYAQNKATIPFSMSRGPLPAPARPQEPKPPYPYRSTDVTFPSGPLTVAGTLTEPDGPGPFPAVVLITGSGAQDRDETIAGHKPFLLLADTFTRAGFAVLRTDDRGVGGTGGSLDQAGYADLAGDALAGVAFLRGRAEIDPARLTLFGHSEGGYLAPLAAQQSSGQVHAVVMMAGPAVTGEDVLVEQNRAILTQQGAAPATVDTQVRFVQELTDLLRAGRPADATELAKRRITEQSATLPENARPSADAVAAQAAQLTSPVFAAFLLHDPTPALTALAAARTPVLAFYGSRDLQVPATQSAPAAQRLFAGDPAATVHVFPDVNHLMQPTQTGSVAEYGSIETTVDPAVLDYVTTWLKEHAA